MQGRTRANSLLRVRVTCYTDRLHPCRCTYACTYGVASLSHTFSFILYIYISFREISSSTSCYVFFFFFFLFFFKTLARRSFLSLSLSVLLPFLSLSSIITHTSTAHIYRYRIVRKYACIPETCVHV